MAMSPAKAKPPARRILFLADCGPRVGGGHVMRCLSLARALLDRGATCAMVSPPAVERVLDVFADPRIEHLAVAEGPLHALVDAARELAGSWSADVAVIDHYGLSAEQERHLRLPITAIDDLADRPRHCALLIDPSLGREPQDYAALAPKDAIVLTGPAYALLAPAYAEMRAGALAARRPAAAPRKLLVSLGLMDLRGVTGRALNALEPLLEGLEVDVVVGGQAQSLPWLNHLTARDPRVRLHVDTRDMAALIGAADIGIGAGGSSTWERAALGLPSLSLVLADNQRQLTSELDRRGATLAVEARSETFASDLQAAFGRLRADGDLRQALSERSAALCDGQGAGRSARAVMQLVD
jgi:UDP-2,4-diacetamido-2,4,6-trideoxy-beta-L-altropyranose hydrolase